MNRYRFPIGIVLLASCLTAPFGVQAQDVDPSQYQAAPYAAPTYSQAQLDQLLAPIALYPDPLIGQILMASTYPLEVVEASRWLQNPNNAAMQGQTLALALDQQPWDPSVKSLVPFPRVLNMMNTNIQWTEQLGDAFLAQQPTVMDSVQRLRQQARSVGALYSNQQQAVYVQGQDILIQPVNPDFIYVPAYNPAVVYGRWQYVGYPPYSFYPPGYAYGATFIGFGVGIAVTESLWGWDRWDWRNHRIDIDDRRYSALNHGYAPSHPGVWEHNPDHRRGVPYRDANVRAHYQNNSSPEEHRAYRGYAPTPQASQERATPFHNVGTPGVQHAAPSPQTRVQPVQADHTPSQYGHDHGFYSQDQNHASALTGTMRAPEQHPTAAAPMQVQHAASPIFESFSRGPDARAQSMRGSESRSSMPTPMASPSRPTPPTAPHVAAPQAVPQSHISAPAPQAAQPHAESGGGSHGGEDAGGGGQHMMVGGMGMRKQ